MSSFHLIVLHRNVHSEPGETKTERIRRQKTRWELKKRLRRHKGRIKTIICFFLKASNMVLLHLLLVRETLLQAGGGTGYECSSLAA